MGYFLCVEKKETEIGQIQYIITRYYCYYYYYYLLLL